MGSRVRPTILKRGGSMMKFNAAGFTAAGVLAVAVLGGAAGGAMVLGGGDEPAQPRPVQMGLKVAEDSTPAPSPGPSTEPTMAPESATGPADAPEMPVPPKQKTAADYAEQAGESAKRSEQAAERAEDAAKRAESVPVPTPVPTPVGTPPQATPKPYMPGSNTKAGEACPGYEGASTKVGDGPWLKCKDGVWQVDESKATPAPTPPTPPED